MGEGGFRLSLSTISGEKGQGTSNFEGRTDAGNSELCVALPSDRDADEAQSEQSHPARLGNGDAVEEDFTQAYKIVVVAVVRQDVELDQSRIICLGKTTQIDVLAKISIRQPGPWVKSESAQGSEGASLAARQQKFDLICAAIRIALLYFVVVPHSKRGEIVAGSQIKGDYGKGCRRVRGPDV